VSPWAIMFWVGAAIALIFVLAIYAAMQLP
jgi:hypothetical protein